MNERTITYTLTDSEFRVVMDALAFYHVEHAKSDEQRETAEQTAASLSKQRIAADGQ